MAKNIVTTDTPVGILAVAEEGGKITQLLWNAKGSGACNDVLKQALLQLSAYFSGALHQFDLPLAPKGGSLQQKVYAAMQAIPFGQTRSYGDLAKELDTPAQAIGQICGENPIPVIIPCHRIVGANGLGGFSGFGGIETKVALLKHEGSYSLLL